jgi:hypothetical protein
MLGYEAVNATVEVAIEDRIKGTVRAEARAEVDRVVTATVQQMHTQQAQVRPPVYVEPQKQSGYTVNI